MKIKVIAILGFALINFSFAANSSLTNTLNLSGTYNCVGYGDKVGPFQSIIKLKIDQKESILNNGMAAYHFSEGDQESTASYGYTGEAVANGNNLAVYFANTDPKQQDDHGVGIAFVTHDLDSHGKSTTVLHKYYYAPAYEGGANGSETCTKIN